MTSYFLLEEHKSENNGAIIFKIIMKRTQGDTQTHTQRHTDAEPDQHSTAMQTKRL